MIRAVIFDYGGVVAGKVTDFYVTDSSGKKIPGDPSIEKVARRLGVGYTSLFEYIEKDIHRLQRGVLQEEKMWERVAEHFNCELPTDHTSLLAEGYLEIYPENPEMVDVMKNSPKPSEPRAKATRLDSDGFFYRRIFVTPEKQK